MINTHTLVQWLEDQTNAESSKIVSARDGDSVRRHRIRADLFDEIQILVRKGEFETDESDDVKSEPEAATKQDDFERHVVDGQSAADATVVINRMTVHEARQRREALRKRRDDLLTHVRLVERAIARIADAFQREV